MGKFMEKLKNDSIKRKLEISHGIITMLSAVIAIILLLGMWSISKNIKTIVQGPMTNISDVADVKYGLTDLQRSLNRLVAEGEGKLEENYPNFEKVVEEDVNLVVTAVKSMDERFSTESGKSKLEEMKSKIEEGENVRPQVMELLKSGKFDEGYKLNYETYLPIVNEIKSLTGELEEIVTEHGESMYSSAIRMNVGLIAVGIILVVGCFVVSIWLTKMMSKLLTVPIDEIMESAKTMYTGDMSAYKMINYHSEDELGQLADAMRGTMKNLHAYIEEISETLAGIAKGDLTKDKDSITDFLGDFASIKKSFMFILKNFNRTLTGIQDVSSQVESGSAEIARAASDLSSGTTEQAGAVQELTSTIETVASLSEKSATDTQEAYDNISEVVSTAEQEQKKMDELTEEMRHITDISKKIEEITSAIEDIASQTSLLALNASIEAARAGEAGKGFAVVAEQIGKLATDSSSSAVDTRKLIQETMEEIQKGSDITASVAVAYRSAIDEMLRFADVAKSTNQAARAQADALGEIEKGIEQISSVTQNTAAASEESSAISEQLAERAEKLDGLINRFKLYAGK